MATDHPITPTLKLFRKWTEYRGTDTEDQFWWRIATQAAQWGADQELEECCEVLQGWRYCRVDDLRDHRRPRPPSLKEQALDELDRIPTHDNEGRSAGVDISIIRRALEALPE